MFGLHVIEEISEETSVFDASGTPLRTGYSIRLRGYEGSPFSDVLSVLSLLA